MSWAASGSIARRPYRSGADVDWGGRRSVDEEVDEPGREVARDELGVRRVELGDRPPPPFAHVLELLVGHAVPRRLEVRDPREEPALALVVLGVAPGEHVTAAPDLRAEGD